MNEILMEKFVCTNCGNHFEHEAVENIICPKCHWSTSVRREKEAAQAVLPPKIKAETPSRIFIPEPEPQTSHPVLMWSLGILFAAVLAGISFFALNHLKKQDEILHKIETKNAQVIAQQAPDLALLPEQQEILNRTVTLENNRPVTEKEKEILGPRSAFRSRSALGIPTPPWNEKEFEAFLKTQQAQYQLPLEWSYRRKLSQLFKEHYLPATQAFEAKDYLKARDEWIRSLAFPVYANDIRKHRGVVLTMLRPFINDTIAKIGSMNASLAGNDLVTAEAKMKSDYDSLVDLFQKESWEEASAKILDLKEEIARTEKLPRAANPPPLPKEISLVDQDIREVLFAQTAPAQTSAPDWDALRGDLASKERVIESHLAASLESVGKQYQAALLLIKNKSWQDAKEELGKIEYPEELAQDAREKIKVLDQLTQVSSAAADTQKE